MSTAAASRFDDRELHWFYGVASRRELSALGISSDHVASQIAARRWQVDGQAVLLHNAEPTVEQRRRMALIKCGPRTALTSFTGLEEQGLVGWERDQVHVLSVAGARRPPDPSIVLHRTSRWRPAEILRARRLHCVEPAAVIAASSFRDARPACGLLAATVQQRLTDAKRLRDAVDLAPRSRHRALLIHALNDIEQGAQALSEIDFTRLCARAGLPHPARQQVRREPNGRRRYLDVEWVLRDCGPRALEVDGAIHLRVNKWWEDQLRQNEVVIGGTPVLRFPSVVIRTEPRLVVDQLRRFLR